MLVSTQTEVTARVLGDFEGVRLLCETGYDALDYSMFDMKNDDHLLNTTSYISHVRELRNIAEGCGVFFDQAHALFPSMRDGDEDYNKKMFPRITRGIEIAGMLGAKTIIVHPVHFAEDQFEKNVELYQRLTPFAKEYGVKIALENMWGRAPDSRKIIPNVCSTAEDFPRYVKALPAEYFTACLDIGHCGLVGDNAPNMIHALGHDLLTALHIHDNDGEEDLHYPPFTVSLDWNAIVMALREIDYSGVLTLEADGILESMPAELFPYMEKYMYESVRRLQRMLEDDEELLS